MAPTDFETALQRTSEVEITTIGRVSGRKITCPVWFVREGGSVYLLPVTGSESQWYRNLEHSPEVRLAADGAGYRTTAHLITEAGQVDHVVDGFRGRYGTTDVANYYPHPDVAVEVPLA